MQTVLPTCREHVAAITVEVPSYTDAFSGRMGQIIENAVQMSLGAFLRLAARPAIPTRARVAPALDGAYALGQGEARQGRSIDALLAAYRVGARVAWRELSATAVELGSRRDDRPVRRAGVRVHRRAVGVQRYRARRRTGLPAGNAALSRPTCAGPARGVTRCCRPAPSGRWPPPKSLTAVLLPVGQARGLMSLRPIDTRTQRRPSRGRRGGALVLLLIPDMEGPTGHDFCGCSEAASVGRSGPPVDSGTIVLPTSTAVPRCDLSRAGRGVDTDAHLVEWCSAPTAMRPKTCAAGRWLRWRSYGPTPLSGLPKRCDPGYCTKANATPSPPICSSTPDRPVPHGPAARAVRRTLNDPQAVLELVVALSIPMTVDSPAYAVTGPGPRDRANRRKKGGIDQRAEVGQRLVGPCRASSAMFCHSSVASSPNWDGKSLLAVRTAVARSSAALRSPAVMLVFGSNNASFRVEPRVQHAPRTVWAMAELRWAR